MSLKQIWFFIPCLCFLYFSCKSTKSNSNTKTKQASIEQRSEAWRSDPLFDTAWFDTLQSKKSQAKKEWLTRNNIFRDFSKPPHLKYSNVFTTEEDLKNCDFIPLEVFTMKTDEFRKLPASDATLMDKFLTLNKDKAQFYIVKDLKFYYRYMTRIYKDTLMEVGYGPLDKNLSDTLSMIVFQKKYKVFSIYIPDAFMGREFLVYKKDDIIMNIGIGGKLTTFKETLRALL